MEPSDLGPGPRGGLASVASARGEVEPDSLELSNLLQWRQTARLTCDWMRQLHSLNSPAAGWSVWKCASASQGYLLPQAPRSSGHRPFRRSLSRAALAVRASRLTEEEQAILFTLSRDPDPRAREIVARVAAIFLRTQDSPSVEAALVAALFDPESSVVNAALRSIRGARLSRLSRGSVSAGSTDLPAVQPLRESRGRSRCSWAPDR